MNTLDTKAKISYTRLMDLFTGAEKEIGRAMENHPMFPDIMARIEGRDLEVMLKNYRWMNDNGKETAISIFMEELYEFIEAVKKGDRKEAEAELVQCVAMLGRIFVHLDEYISRNVAAGKTISG